ncbi:hypothetical protein GBF38_012947 [Nibea albiflora]|uniref:Uncharacterized protein n=1 Tax=Nibea albiflora TaxID=240163 RepID=A0ACB7EZD2_NIBAL|nr:hypothetical protein GBF38_012947 [Nibea albiflora]
MAQHTHAHYIPPYAARGEGEVLREVNITPNGWGILVRYCRAAVCSGLFGQSGGKIQNRAMRSECAHKAEHTLQKHVKESVKLLLTLGVLQHGGAGKREPVLRGKVQFVSIKRALS